jgi:hypothetical protein
VSGEAKTGAQELRARVSSEPSIVRRLQRIIPGWHGYRAREDVRQSDQILRSFLSQKLAESSENLKEARRLLVEQSALDSLDALQSAINEFDLVATKLEHAEAGYTSYAYALHADVKELEKLYEYDAAFAETVASINEKTKALREACENETAGKKEIRETISAFRDFKKALDDRKRVLLQVNV